MEDPPASSCVSSRLPGQRGTRHQPASRYIAQRTITDRFCGAAAALLLIFLSCSLFLLRTPALASAAPRATRCPTSNLPPTPTVGAPFDNNGIKINELLANPKLDWNCNGTVGADDQWIELINLGSTDANLIGLQVCCDTNNQAILLPTTDRIAAHSFLVIFNKKNISGTLIMSPNGGTLELLDGQGNPIDTVNYPALEPDQSYIRDSSGQWSVSNTPTPGAPNINGSSPTPTATRRSGGRGSGGGGSGGGASTATPTPIGSVFIPTDTPDLAPQSPGNNASSGGNGGSFPSWLKTMLLILLGAGLLAVVIWYMRSWGKESESDI